MSTVLAQHNYYRLLALVPDLSQMRGQRCSQVGGQQPLQLEVLEQTPYSTLCHISLHGSGDGDGDDSSGTGSTPHDLLVQVRVYHDAEVAEVISYRNRFGGSEVFKQGFVAGAALSSKRELNFFLWKWLGHCIAHGHQLSDRLEEVSP